MDPITFAIELELGMLILSLLGGFATGMQHKHRKLEFLQAEKHRQMDHELRERHHQERMSVLSGEHPTVRASDFNED